MQSAPTTVTNASVGSCSAQVYRGSECEDELLAYQRCIPSRADSSDVYILNGDIQDEVEKTAKGLQLGFTVLEATQECKEAALPLLCLFFFGLCDDQGKDYLPSRNQCIALESGVCAAEFKKAMNFPSIQAQLPICDRLPEETVECGCKILFLKT